MSSRSRDKPVSRAPSTVRMGIEDPQLRDAQYTLDLKRQNALIRKEAERLNVKSAILSWLLLLAFLPTMWSYLQGYATTHGWIETSNAFKDLAEGKIHHAKDRAEERIGDARGWGSNWARSYKDYTKETFKNEYEHVYHKFGGRGTFIGTL